MRKIISNKSSIIQDSYIPQVYGYAMHSVLGKGGMGTTYLATQVSLNRPVVVKILDTHKNDLSIIREALSAIQCGKDNPHVVNIIDIVNTSDGRVCCVMEYIDGETLDEFLNNRDKIDTIDIINVARQICYGLNSLHESGMMYLDIKPENIFIMKNENRIHVKIIDFGTVRKEGDFGGKIIGTPENCAPEVLLGGEVDRRSDIYSLGVLMYYLSTGINPLAKFIENNPGNEYAKVRAGIVKGVSFDELRESVNLILAPVIQKAMHLDPNQRFQSLNDLNEALESIRDEMIVREYSSNDIESEALENLNSLVDKQKREIESSAVMMAEIIQERENYKKQLENTQRNNAALQQRMLVLEQAPNSPKTDIESQENNQESLQTSKLEKPQIIEPGKGSGIKLQIKRDH